MTGLTAQTKKRSASPMTSALIRIASLLGVVLSVVLLPAGPVSAASPATEGRDTDGVGKHTEIVDVSLAAGSALKLTVDSLCRKGKVVFRMKNDGSAWPGAATMQVIDADTGKVLTGRTLRLKANQSAGFSILPADGTETLSLKIEATWLPEAYEHSVGQSCK